MSGSSRCPSCGCTIFLPGRAAGLEVFCRACGRENRVVVDLDGTQKLMAADADCPSVPASLRKNTGARGAVRAATWVLLLVSTLALAVAYARSAYGFRGLVGVHVGETVGDLTDLVDHGLAYAIGIGMLGLFVWAKLGSHGARFIAFTVGFLVLLQTIATDVLLWLGSSGNVWALGLIGAAGAFHVTLALLLLAGLLGARRLRRNDELREIEAQLMRDAGDDR